MFDSTEVKYQLVSTDTEVWVTFNLDKTFNLCGKTSDDQVYGCYSKTIDALIVEKRAIIFNPTTVPSAVSSIQEYMPDAIRCGENGIIFYAHIMSKEKATYKPLKPNENIYMEYVDGTVLNYNHDPYCNPCKGKSIEQLYNDCSAFNFVTEKVTTVTGKNTNDEINDWPHALECSTNNTIKNIFYQLSLKITSENLIRYSPNSDKDKVIDFNADGTYKSTTTTVQEGCIDKSLTDLAAEGRAYKFSSENHIYRAVCTTTESMIDGWPDA